MNTSTNLQPADTPKPEMAARPKVLRRPEKLSMSTLPVCIETPQPIEEHKQPLPSAPYWQNDGRFAAVLLGVLLAINILVGAWLSVLSPATTPVQEEPPTLTQRNASSLEPAADMSPMVHILDDVASDASEQ